MGDRTTVWFRFSGRVHASQVDDLLDACSEAYAYPESDGENFTIDTISDILVVDECNYADPDDLIDAAEALGLSYVMWWAPGGGYGAGYKIRFAVPGNTITCDADHDLCPVLNRNDLDRFDTIQAAQEWLDLFINSETTLPPLEVYGDAGTDDVQ